VITNTSFIDGSYFRTRNIFKIKRNVADMIPFIMFFIAADSSGKSEQWSVACSTPNILVRKGWSNGVLKPGDKVSVTFRPMKDGSKAGQLLTIITAKGETLKDHDY
jgi:hypothetical protein